MLNEAIVIFSKMDIVVSKLKSHIKRLPQEIRKFTGSELYSRPAQGKWSKIEIMGHLVDSARYNLLRFTEAQYKPLPYVVEGYAQDDLVRVNDYQNLPLETILDTWTALNNHIVLLLSNLSEEQQQIPIIRNGEPHTLGWLAEDYLSHMEHHLAQILGSNDVPMRY